MTRVVIIQSLFLNQVFSVQTQKLSTPPRRELNPQPSEIQLDALTIELLGYLSFVYFKWSIKAQHRRPSFPWQVPWWLFLFVCTMFFPNNFPWQVLIARVCSWTSCPWLKAPQGSLSRRKNLFNLCLTDEQIKLVKENLVVCAGLKILK